MTPEIREILEELAKHYYTTHNEEACEFCEKELDQTHQAIISLILEKMPKEKKLNDLEFPHSMDYSKGAYSGFNHALAEMRERIEKL